MLDVSIVISAHKEPDSVLTEAINSAMTQIADRRYDETLPSYEVLARRDVDSRGVAFNRNRLIKESKGKWIICLDGDDLLPSDYLANMWLRAAKKDYTSLVASSVQFIAGCRFDRFDSYICLKNFSPEIAELNAAHLNASQKAFEYNLPMGMAAMFSKKGWKKIGGFDERLMRTNDLDFWIRYRHLGGKIRHTGTTQLFRRNLKVYSLANTAAEQKELEAKRDASMALFEEKHGIKLRSLMMPYQIPYTADLRTCTTAANVRLIP
jgi:glycosyltransferase involved in cell wall biosynthesis